MFWRKCAPKVAGFPTLVGTTSVFGVTSSTDPTFDVPYPSGTASGDLIVFVMAVGTTWVLSGTDWTLRVRSPNDANNMLFVFTRTAGSETAMAIGPTTTSPRRAGGAVFAFRNANNSAPIAASGIANGNTTDAIIQPEATAAVAGSYRWITAVSLTDSRSSVAISGLPSGYTEHLSNYLCDSAAGNAIPRISVSSKSAYATAENPSDDYEFSVARTWYSLTCAVAPL